MPTNVTPEYKRAEAAFREAKSLDEKVVRLEDMISLLPKHKGTDHLLADLKKKLSNLRSQLEEGVKKSGRSRYAEITREGAAQVVLVGPPNCGKSSFVRSLSHAHPEVGDYPFTTSTMTPGMIPYEDILIELIDTPPVTADYMHGQLLGLVRAADGIALVADLSSDSLIEDTETTFQVFSNRHVEFVREIGQNNRDSIPAVVFANKMDAPDSEERFDLLHEMIADRLDIVKTTAESPVAESMIPRYLFNWLEITRVYTKTPGEKAKLEKPYTLFSGDTVGDLCRLVHQDFYEKLHLAKLWRGDAGPLTVSKHEELLDGDILELHI